MTVDAAPPASEPARLTLAGDAFTSAVGARLPFSITTRNSDFYKLKIDASTSSTFSGGRPCGLTGATLSPPASNQAYNAGFDSVVEWGDLQTGGTPCFLNPDTTYYVRLCTVRYSDLAELDCRTTTIHTGVVNTSFTPPPQSAAGLFSSTSALAAQHQVVGGHPAGQLFVQRRLKGGGGGFTNASGNLAVAQGSASTSPVSRTLTGLTAWRTNEIQSCFAQTGGATFCGAAIDVVAGYATAPSDATEVGETSATLSGQASAPSPDGTMRFLVGTTNPGARDVRTVLSQGASAPMAARGSAGAAVTATAGGLTPGTDYYWAACFDNPAESGIEGCSPVRTFHTLGTAPAPPPPEPPAPGGGGEQPSGGGSPPGGGSQPAAQGPVGGTADVLKPKVSLKLKGKVKRRGKVTLSVVASDASGIKSVLIKVGKGKAQSKRSVKISLPRRKGSVKVAVTVTDGAGNVTTVKKTLKVK
jgi:hypothetical protein